MIRLRLRLLRVATLNSGARARHLLISVPRSYISMKQYDETYRIDLRKRQGLRLRPCFMVSVFMTIVAALSLWFATAWYETSGNCLILGEGARYTVEPLAPYIVPPDISEPLPYFYTPE
jgi:hypothetical protein